MTLDMKSLVVMRSRKEPLYIDGYDTLELARIVGLMLSGLENVRWFTAKYMRENWEDPGNPYVISNGFLMRLSSNSKNTFPSQLKAGHDKWGNPCASLLFNAELGEVYTIHVGTTQHIESVRLDLLKN